MEPKYSAVIPSNLFKREEESNDIVYGESLVKNMKKFVEYKNVDWTGWQITYILIYNILFKNLPHLNIEIIFFIFIKNNK